MFEVRTFTYTMTYASLVTCTRATVNGERANRRTPGPAPGQPTPPKPMVGDREGSASGGCALKSELKCLRLLPAICRSGTQCAQVCIEALAETL
jgi:hypothetical protein